MTSASDLFGGLSSDDDSFLVEGKDEEKVEPVKTAAQALLMDFDLSSDDDDDEAPQSQKSTSSSPPLDKKDLKPMTTTQTLMMDFEMSSDDDEPSSTSPIDQKPVKFFLPSDEDSQDMPDIDEIQKRIKDGTHVFKMSPESMEDSEDRKCVEFKTSPPSSGYPPLKKPKLEPRDDRYEAVFDAVLGNTTVEPPVEPKPTVIQKKKYNEMNEMERKMIKIEEKEYVTEEESHMKLLEQYGPSSSQESKKHHDDIHEMKNQILLANMSKEQFDRYQAFRSSRFKKSDITRLIKEYTNNAKIPATVVTAIGGLAKLVVGELVEEALDLREAVEGEEPTGPLQPHHIRQAYLTLSRQGKL
ncbi:hypothetical protein CAEBREN_23505 [Caenorhabditis brenneri]|uniref:TAFII28-like protein domain-containing protein n=1 Tax=Caenorhabditis brenneri TaxID=135651 RepID=G0N3L8_CAEBE|nr:hypothetical protein CAEBREN_23505 [Caenorhabditis brenneri]